MTPLELKLLKEALGEAEEAEPGCASPSLLPAPALLPAQHASPAQRASPAQHASPAQRASPARAHLAKLKRRLRLLGAQLTQFKIFRRHALRRFRKLERRLAECVSSAAAGNGGEDCEVPGAALEGRATEEMHLRLLFDRGKQYVATLVADKQKPDGTYEITKGSRLAPVLTIAKSAEVLRLVAASVCDFTIVFRALVAKDDPKKKDGCRKLAGLYISNRKPDGSIHRCLRDKGRTPVHVTLCNLVAVDVVKDKNDAAAVYALAAKMYPLANGMAPRDLAAHARANGLLTVSEVDNSRKTLLKLGLDDPASRFMEVAMGLEADGVARVAFDPRFGSVFCTAALAAKNAHVRRMAEAVASTTLSSLATHVLAPRTRSMSLADFTLPFPIKPASGAGPAESPRLYLRDAPTGLYRSIGVGHRSKQPSAVVLRRGHASEVVGYVYDSLYAVGTAALLPLDERNILYTPASADLAWAATFANRLDAAAFDGDEAWTDADIARALSLAKRAAWVFQNPEGSKAKELQARVIRAAE
jgi:hypothetical protein